MLAPRSWPGSARLIVASLALALAPLVGCGGSSSETPFPQSPSEITSEPLLRRPPQQPAPRGSAGRRQQQAP